MASVQRAAATLVITVPFCNGLSTFTSYRTVTEPPMPGTEMPVAMLGGVPGVPPADAGDITTLPGTNVVFAGSVSLTTVPVALPLPELVSVITYRNVSSGFSCGGFRFCEDLVMVSEGLLCTVVYADAETGVMICVHVTDAVFVITRPLVKGACDCTSKVTVTACPGARVWPVRIHGGAPTPAISMLGVSRARTRPACSESHSVARGPTEGTSSGNRSVSWTLPPT